MRLDLRHITTTRAEKGRQPVLENVSLTISSGDVIGITGKSGCGKTTLGLILSGLLRPDSGTVMINDHDFWAANRRERRAMGKRIQIVFQHPESTFDPRWTIQKSLSEPYRLKGIRPGNAALSSCLETVGLFPSMLQRFPHQLSGGELQRIALARIMILKPDVVVLDEPTAMLDLLTQAKIISLFEEFCRKTNTASVLVSHDPALVRRFCKKRYQLENGRLILGNRKGKNVNGLYKNRLEQRLERRDRAVESIGRKIVSGILGRQKIG